MNRLTEIQTMLADDAQRGALPDTELGALESELATLFADIREGKIEGTRSNDIVVLRDISDAARVLREEAQARFEIAGLAAEVRPPAAPPSAAQASLGDLAAAVPAASQPTPRIDHMRPRWQLVNTREEADMAAIAEATVEAVRSMDLRGYSGPAVRIPIGRLTRQFAEERTLDSRNMGDAEDKVAAVLDNAWDADRWSDQALVASGGFCAPPAVAYDVPTISGAQRPVWGDYLPLFRADRGGLVFMTPPSLASIKTSTAQGAGSAISIWTNTIDTTPGGTTKPKQTIACPAQQTVTLQAVVEQVQIGNLLARATPEVVSAFLTLVNSAHARVAETQNLSDIDAASNAMTVAKLLGATADLGMSVRQAAARYRNSHRMARDARLRVLFPAWVIDFIAADVSQRHAGDGLEIFTVDEMWVRSMFASMNVNVTFYEDASTTAGTQVLGAQGPTDIRNWPLTVVWYLFHEGAFLGLDGGTLDLGIVRDSTLNGTNDYQIFSEAFEKVAFRGLESQKVTQTICPTGEGANDHAALTCAAS